MSISLQDFFPYSLSIPYTDRFPEILIFKFQISCILKTILYSFLAYVIIFHATFTLPAQECTTSMQRDSYLTKRLPSHLPSYFKDTQLLSKVTSTPFFPLFRNTELSIRRVSPHLSKLFRVENRALLSMEKMR